MVASQKADLGGWQSYRSYLPGPGHTVVGNLKILPSLYSPTLRNERSLVVYLPPSYVSSSLDYPVIYMMDGQNLFDVVTAHSGEWRVDETMERLSGEGIEAIIVAVANGGQNRTNEYSPFEVANDGGGQASQFIEFLTATVMPEIQARFRVSSRREDTFLFGSSLGALISLYGIYERPEMFGGAGLMSPSLWHGDYAIFDYLATKAPSDGRIYIDVGTRELSGRFSFLKLHYHSRQYYLAARKLHNFLEATVPHSANNVAIFGSARGPT